MIKVIVDKEYDIGVDPSDGEVWYDGWANVLSINTYDNSVTSMSFSPQDARRIGKSLIAFADSYVVRVDKAKARGKNIEARIKKELERDRAA